MAAAPPQKIGRYEVRSILGEGAFGVVYLAWDPELQSEVAIKLCKPLDDGTQAAETIARFKREARVAAKLQHPNIVPVRDMGAVTVRGRKQPWFAMPYIPGSTLETEIKNGRKFSDAEIVQIITGIAQGLQYAHAAGLVHRDIKPANIMLDEKGKPLIADFGMVHVSEASMALSQAGQTLGTPAYMPPEQVKHIPGDIDARADIYSTGVVMYELLCNDIPYHGPAMSVMFNIVQGTAFPKPSEVRAGVNPQLEQICLTAMAHAKDQRFETASDLTGAVADAVNHKSTVSIAPATTQNRPAQRGVVPPPPPPPPPRSGPATVISAEATNAARTRNNSVPNMTGRPARRASTQSTVLSQPHSKVPWKLAVGILMIGITIFVGGALTGKPGSDPAEATDSRLAEDAVRSPDPPQPPSTATPANSVGTDSASVLINSIGMQLKLVPAGAFMMGSPDDEEFRSDVEFQHRVKLTDPFYLQTTEVTQGQWQAVMGTTPWNGSGVEEGTNYAASFISWDDAVAFCKKLSEVENKTYRLPTRSGMGVRLPCGNHNGLQLW